MKKHGKDTSDSEKDKEKVINKGSDSDLKPEKQVLTSSKRNSKDEERKDSNPRKNQVVPLPIEWIDDDLEPRPSAQLLMEPQPSEFLTPSKLSASSISTYSISSYSSSSGSGSTAQKSKRVTKLGKHGKSNYDTEIAERMKEREEQMQQAQMTRHLREAEYNQRKLLQEKQDKAEKERKQAKKKALLSKLLKSARAVGQAARRNTLQQLSLSHKSKTSLEVELKRGVLTESVITTPNRYNRQEKQLKVGSKLIEQLVYVDQLINQNDVKDLSDTDNELSCVPSKKRKRVQGLKDAVLKKDHIFHTWLAQETSWERKLIMFQKWLKWMVVLIAVTDICLAVEYSYEIVIKQIKYEFFFKQGIFNCDRLLSHWYMVGLYTHVTHAAFSTMLLWMENRKSAQLGLCWILSQVFLWMVYAVEAFFKVRFLKDPFPELFKHVGWRWSIDIVQVVLVGFRYLKISRVMDLRMYQLAHKNRVKGLNPALNDELLMQNSSLFKRKEFTRKRILEQHLEMFEYLQAYHIKFGKFPDKETRKDKLSECVRNLKLSDKDYDIQRIKKLKGEAVEVDYGNKLPDNSDDKNKEKETEEYKVDLSDNDQWDLRLGEQEEDQEQKDTNNEFIKLV